MIYFITVYDPDVVFQEGKKGKHWKLLGKPDYDDGFVDYDFDSPGLYATVYYYRFQNKEGRINFDIYMMEYCIVRPGEMWVSL
jgi:hypothetical protein